MAMGYDRVIAVERDFQLTFPRLLADGNSLRTAGVETHVAEQMLRTLPHHRPDRFVVDDIVETFAFQVFEALISRCPSSAVSITASSPIDALNHFAELSGPVANMLASSPGRISRTNGGSPGFFKLPSGHASCLNITGTVPPDRVQQCWPLLAL